MDIMNSFQTVYDLEIIEKMNNFIRKITFFDNHIIFLNKEWLISNNYIAFPILSFNIKEDEDILEFFNKANNYQNFYVSGLSLDVGEHITLKSIKNYIPDFFISPNYLYEVIDKFFYLDIMERPYEYIAVNFDFNLGVIYYSDSEEYFIFGKKEYIEMMFGDFNTFIEKSLLEKEKIIKMYQEEIKHVDTLYFKDLYKKNIKYYKKIFNYYESILKEQGYLQ